MAQIETSTPSQSLTIPCPKNMTVAKWMFSRGGEIVFSYRGDEEDFRRALLDVRDEINMAAER